MNLATVIAEHDYHGWHDGGPPWPIFPLLFLLVIGALVTVAVVRARRPKYADATAILAERFARGEIDHDEYRQRLAQLSEKRR